MLYLFKQAVNFCGKDYHRGVHEVPEAVEYDPHFLKFVGAGLIEEAQEDKVISPASIVDRNKRLHEELLKRAAAKKAAAAKPAEEEAEEKADESDDEKPEKADKKKKKG